MLAWWELEVFALFFPSALASTLWMKISWRKQSLKFAFHLIWRCCRTLTVHGIEPIINISQEKIPACLCLTDDGSIDSDYVLCSFLSPKGSAHESQLIHSK